jgi:hypothetical protein
MASAFVFYACSISLFFSRLHKKEVKKISGIGVKNCPAITETVKKINITKN